MNHLKGRDGKLDCLVSDLNLAPAGRRKIVWAGAHMPVLARISADFQANKPLQGLRIAVSVHVEAKTACLAELLAKGGAQVALTGCNPLSTQDDVAAALAAEGMLVYCIHGADAGTYRKHLEQALSIQPHLIVDDGGDFAQLLHTDLRACASDLIGGCEETTTGVHRLQILEREGRLLYPVIAVNNARCKNLFDNRYGTGQSVWTAVMGTTNLLIAGKVVVVAGFGMCGKGVAMRARALGARVIVTEIDPIKACEALMEGYDVMTMRQAAALGNIFITLTGCRDVLGEQHYPYLKDGAILCNAGHFDVEINLPQLASLSVAIDEARPNIRSYHLTDGRTIHVLAQGRLVNLAAGDGHPVEIMDMSFALQALSLVHMARHGKDMKPGVYEIPESIDQKVASYLLEHLGKQTESLTANQAWYLEHWDI
jgi:adenosylhomocysteinase